MADQRSPFLPSATSRAANSAAIHSHSPLAAQAGSAGPGSASQTVAPLMLNRPI